MRGSVSESGYIDKSSKKRKKWIKTGLNSISILALSFREASIRKQTHIHSESGNKQAEIVVCSRL